MPLGLTRYQQEGDNYLITLIQREFGPGGLARFIRLHRSGPGDYTAERHQWQAGITLAEIERELDKH